MRDSICVFLDTNILLHFPPLHQIDWRTICGSRSVSLVICLTVIHELDAKKSDSRLSGRAERAIKEIREATKSGAEIRAGVSVAVFNKEVRAADFPDTLSPDSADDRIVHLAKMYEGENPNFEVAIATADYGMELRAEAVGVALIALDSSLRLPNPQDELTKNYQKAISDLNSLKNRQPKLSLGLSLPDGEMALPHEVTFEFDGFWEPLDIDAAMQAIQQEHPKQSGRRAQANHLLVMAGHISPQSWAIYDEELDEFYGGYREYLEIIDIIGKAKAWSFEFDLWLSNDGNSLATDVDVVLRFPTKVQLIAEKGTEDAEPLEKEFEPPKPPKRPEPRRYGDLDRMVAVSNIVNMPERVPFFSHR